jgi:hypothetical protein
MWRKKSRNLYGLRTVRSLLVSAFLVVASSASNAGTIVTTLSPFTGSDASITVTLDDMADPDNIVITLDVNVAPTPETCEASF